jgi:hypothetical protein
MTTDPELVPVAQDFAPCRCGEQQDIVIQHLLDRPVQLRGDVYVAVCRWCGKGVAFVSCDPLRAVMPEAVAAWNAAATIADHARIVAEVRAAYDNRTRDWYAQGDAYDAMKQRAEAAESELAALRARVEGLQAFAQDVMECWPEGAPDGGDLQEFATKHGLLREVVMPGPCGEDCGCTEFISSDEWPSTCYRKTSLLTGRPESDASIDRLLAAPARPVTDDLVTTTERG